MVAIRVCYMYVIAATYDVGDVGVDLAVVVVDGIGGGRVGKTAVSGDVEYIECTPWLWVTSRQPEACGFANCQLHAPCFL